MRREWPLVGRESDLAELVELVASKRAGGPGAAGTQSGGVILRGEIGIGKTRLLTELLEAVQDLGYQSRLVRTSATNVPLGCLTDVLTARLGDRLATVSPEILYHEAIAALMTEATRAGPWLLAIDDLTQLDGTSAAVIHQLLMASPVTLVATARAGEDYPGPFHGLWREGRLLVQEVGPLTDDALGRLVTASLGGPVGVWTRHRLVTLAGGNPLVLRELIEATERAGTLQVSDGVWRLSRDFQAATPQLRTLVEQRFAKVSPAVREASELIALTEPIELAAVVQLAGADTVDDLLSQSLAAVDRRQDSSGASAIIHSAHPLFAEVLRAQLPLSRRRRLADRIERLVPAAELAGPALVRRAVLLLEAGLPIDARLMARGGSQAWITGDRELAVMLSLAALGLATADGDRRAGAEAALALAVAGYHPVPGPPEQPGRPDQPTRLARPGPSRPAADDPACGFEAAWRWASDDVERHRVAAAWSWDELMRGRPEDAFAVIDRLGTDASGLFGRFMAEAMQAALVGYSGRWGDARARSEALLHELAGPAGDAGTPAGDSDASSSAGDVERPTVELALATTSAMSAAFDGPADLALERSRQVQRLIATSTASPSWNQLVYSTGGELYGLGLLNGFDAAAGRARELVAQSLTGQTYLDLTGMWLGVIANLAVTMGVLTPQTCHEADEAVRFLGWRDECGLLTFAVGARALFAVLSADDAAIEEHLGRYETEFRAREVKSSVFADRAQAWMAWRRGDATAAVEWIERAWSGNWDQAQVAAWAAPAAHDLVRFGRPELAVDRLDAAAARLGGPFAAALAAHRRALAEGRPADLIAAADELGRCAAVGLQAEALIQAAELSDPVAAQGLVHQAMTLAAPTLQRTPLIEAAERRLPPPTTPRPEPDGAAPRVTLEARGRSWLIQLGAARVLVRDLTGMRYLAALVSRPDDVVPAGMLVGGESGPRRPSPQPILDDTARAAYRARALAVVDELATARRRGDGPSIGRLETEAEALEHELRTQRQLDGTARVFADAEERARTAVRKAIMRAIDEIGAADPGIAEHLRDRITTGSSCSYRSRR
ncbi:MAG: ATP-binding protein [Acidimicrobiales bacterium]